MPDTSSSEAKKNGGEARRRLARLMAVQALYQQEADGGKETASDITGDAAMAFLRESAGGGTLKPDKALFKTLTAETGARLERLDALISRFLRDGQTVPRLDAVLRALLRVAVYELDTRRDTPSAVLISEYVAIADALAGGPAVPFAHAMLDRLARTLREAP